ncbi:MAG TPA: hypothetical protein PKE17_12235 [Saprospiraceae bacterium]|nr:hypothetical protein [Saprospiraceae bacterium]
MNSLNKIWRYLFYGLMGFHALYQFSFGAMALLHPQSLQASFSFDVKAGPETFLLVGILAFGQFFLAAIAILSIIWISKNKTAGAILGIFLGFYFLLLGIAGLLLVGNQMVLLIDVGRGLFTIISGFVVLKNIKSA